MKHLSLRFALRALAFGLPYLALAVFGLLWLRERQLFLPFAAVASLLLALQWVVLRCLRTRPVEHDPVPLPTRTWPAAGEKAWAEVDRLAASVEADVPPLGDANVWLGLFQQVFETVAAHFHPQSKQPALEVPVVEAIQVAELVARDLRNYLEERLPANRITVRHVYQVIKWGPAVSRVAQRGWNLVRIGRLLWNPVGAIIAEAGALAGGGLGDLAADLPALAAGRFVRLTGRYAIDLYSGQLDLSDPRFSATTAAKPLRIVVLGQAKAGKSSLINAIFGTVRAATDVLPCTDMITPYLLERDGLPRAIIYDTIGFGGAGDKSAQTKLNAELDECDLLIAVTSATTAAREVDRKLLDEARLRFESRIRRAAPPIVVALSHIDAVRPIKEWAPPYDFGSGESTKERNIRDAVQAVAEDLQVPPTRVVPVCLKEGQIYHVNEGLLPLLVQMMPEAERAKLLRVLMQNRDAQQRESLKRLLVKAGLAAAELVLATRR
jgi:predicted GTPase